MSLRHLFALLALPLHGVTRQVVLEGGVPSAEVKDIRGVWRMGTHATGRIQRKDFGLTWNRPLESGVLFLGEEVEIHLDLEWTRLPDELAVPGLPKLLGGHRFLRRGARRRACPKEQGAGGLPGRAHRPAPRQARG